MPRRVRWSLGAGLVAFYVLFRPQGLLSVDEQFVYRTTVALAERGSLWIAPLDQPADAELTPGERIAGKFGVLPSLAAVPFYWLGKTLASFAPAELGDDVRLAVTASASAVWMALAVLELAALVGLLGFSRGVQLATGLVAGLATPVFVYSGSFHIVALTTLLLTALVRRAAWYEAAPSRGRAAVLGGLFGLLLLTSVQFLLLLPIVAWFVGTGGGAGCKGNSSPGGRSRADDGQGAARSERFIAVAWLSATFSVGLLALVAVNLFRADSSPWEDWRHGEGPVVVAMALVRGGYAGENFVTPLRVGLYGLLVSPARGLVWYSPVSVLGVVWFGRFWRDRARLAWLVAALLAVVVVSSSKWWAWNGGLNWGPRYLVAAVPLTVLPIAYGLREWGDLSGARRSLAVVLVVLSGVVQLRGATTDYDRAVAPIASLSRGENERWFVPQLSPLWWKVGVESGSLWTGWYKSGYRGLTLAIVLALGVVAVGGIAAAIGGAGGWIGFPRALAWPVWGALAAIGLFWGVYQIWLSAGHGLRVRVADGSDSTVQFQHDRWSWRAPAAGPAEWTGYLRVPQNGDFYTIYIRANGTAELEIAGTVRLGHAGGPGAWSAWNGRLDEGVYPLKLRSTPPAGETARVGVAWTLHGASIDRQPVGPQFLYPDRPGKGRLLVDSLMEWCWFWVLLGGLLLGSPRRPPSPCPLPMGEGLG